MAKAQNIIVTIKFGMAMKIIYYLLKKLLKREKELNNV